MIRFLGTVGAALERLAAITGEVLHQLGIELTQIVSRCFQPVPEANVVWLPAPSTVPVLPVVDAPRVWANIIVWSADQGETVARAGLVESNSLTCISDPSSVIGWRVRFVGDSRVYYVNSERGERIEVCEEAGDPRFSEVQEGRAVYAGTPAAPIRERDDAPRR